MLDVFTPNAFRLLKLTAAINNTKYAPGRISSLGWFGESGIATLDAAVEMQDGVLTLLDPKPRGAAGTQVRGEKRNVRSFRVPHIPESSALYADEVQGIRAFGSDSQAEVFNTRLNERLTIMRRNIDYTIEAHRLSAVKGIMKDANGADHNLFTEFGVTQQTVAFALTTSTTKIRQKVLNVIEKVEEQLDGVPFSGIRVLCGATFWADFIEHDMVKETYLNTAMANEVRGDPTLSFEYAGATWERYRGTSDVQIADTEAYAVPEGVPELFITRFAPADYVETVNTIGLPYYSKGEVMKFGKGAELEAQSNPLNLCTRPSAVIKLTRT